MSLVLTRKAGQTIRIADIITVTIGQLSEGRVKLVVDAPDDVPIFREEARKKAPSGKVKHG